MYSLIVVYVLMFNFPVAISTATVPGFKSAKMCEEQASIIQKEMPDLVMATSCVKIK